MKFSKMTGTAGKNKLKVIVIILAILGVIALTLFKRWEAHDESWGYWYFARIFAETGRFIILDRSPLYTLYLNAFSWMGYPTSIIMEYLIRSLIAVTAVIALLRKYLGLGLSIFAALLWIPFLQVAAEPPVQALALACSCWGIVARQSRPGETGKAYSYGLFGFAYLFRPSYIIFIITFAVWDIIQTIRKRSFKRFFHLRNKSCYWPIALFLLLLFWISIQQSPHRHNNAHFASTMWFPNDGKILTDASFIQASNVKYIEDKYGTFKDKDFYFTNQELFGGANTMLSAIRANPGVVINQAYRTAKPIILAILGLTSLTFISKLFYLSNYFLAFAAIIGFFLGIAAVYGAFLAAKDESMVLFIINSIILVGAIILFTPVTRHFFPVFPVLILSASWYGSLIKNHLKNVSCRLKFLSGHLMRLIGNLAPFILLILFSNGALGWSNIAGDIADGVTQGDFRILESKSYSLKSSYEYIEPLIRDCKGVLSLEHKFIGAFTSVPLDRIYDVWEIPPFGSLGNPIYGGLRPERVDCVIISNVLATEIGKGTNIQIRYDNYIKPYADYLLSLGATYYEISGFGIIVKLK